MAREKRQIQSNSKETGSSAAGSAADAAMGAAASAATAGYQSRPAATPDEGVSPMDGLPFELENMVAEYVGSDPQSAANLAATCRRYHNLDANKLRLVRKLLECVAGGNQDKAEVLLKIRPDLLTLRLPGYYDKHTDTRFKSVSVWEYALWAGDTRYMANMMLDSIPETTEGAEIKSIVAQQYERHNQRDEEGNLQGLECIAKDGTHYFQKHFDFTPLLDAYARFIAAVDALLAETPLASAPTWDACDALWLVVGREQGKLPVHVRQHYCDPDTAFKPLPTFQAEKLKRCLTFYNRITHVLDLWGSAESSRLGFYFVILRGMGAAVGWPRARGAAWVSSPGDSAAVAALCEVRTKADYAALGPRLVSDLTPTPGMAGQAGRR